jgi:hypothetical protein
MNDDDTYTGLDALDATDYRDETYTQVASCAFGNSEVERRRQSLRARFERENYERQLQLNKSFITSFRNLFSLTKH